MQWFHGLQAYSGKGLLDAVRKADAALDVECCGADRPIGPVGVIVSGSTRFVASRDVWSVLDSDGQRLPDTYHAYRYIGRAHPAEAGPDELEAQECEEFCKSVLNSTDWYTTRDYCESFVRVRAITGVWVKPHADGRTNKVARVIARRHRVKMHVVHSQSRIWDVIGSYIDPSEKYDIYQKEYV